MPRKVRLVTIAMHRNHADTVEKNRELVMSILDRACFEKPDIVCLPENCNTQGVPGVITKNIAELVPGPTTDAAAMRARKFRTYVICPIYRKHGDAVFNSAVIIDRNGEILGIYDKMHSSNISWRAFRESEPYVFDVMAGEQAPVFQLDFGSVGIQICFDLSFDRGWKQLADKKAELIFWPSAYNGGLPLRMRAFQNQCYLASSVATDRASIINPLGEIVSEVRSPCTHLAVALVDLDYLVGYVDWQQARLSEIKKVFGPDIEIRNLQDEGLFLLHSNREDLQVQTIEREFSLVSSKQFFKNHETAWANIPNR